MSFLTETDLACTQGFLNIAPGLEMSFDRDEFSNKSKFPNLRVNSSSVFGKCMNLILKAVQCSAQECDRCYFGNVVTVGANKATNNYVDVS